MKQWGLPVVPYSYGSKFKSKRIFYLNELSHSGQDKVLANSLEISKEKKILSSKFIENSYSTSFRVLFIGKKRFTLQYQSNHDWKSNLGEVSINLIINDETILELLPERPKYSEAFPLLAIDFVKNFETEEYFALDLNTSPGLKGTPVQEILPAYKVVSYLQEHFINTLRSTHKN